MKFRLSYLFVSIIIVISTFAGIFIWRKNYLKEIPNFNEKSFKAPISSQYIPANADLVFHWKSNPNIIPKYIENHQDKKNKNIINKKIKLIRNSLFKLVGLDFNNDISKWAGNNGSFAIFETKNQIFNDWLMVIELKKDINNQENLEIFPAHNLIHENIEMSNQLNISNQQIFTKRINSNNKIFFSNQQDYILISSNPKIIKFSTSQIEDNAISIKEKYKNIHLKENVTDGILLLEMSPKKLIKSIGQEEELLETNKIDKLISSINIDENELILEGVISYDIKNKRQFSDKSNDLIDISNDFDSYENFILIDNPNNYFKNSSNYPYQNLIKSVIQKSNKEGKSRILELILENTQGNLIWLKNKDWLVLTRRTDTNKKEIIDTLKKEKFVNSSIDFKDRNLEIWSKISTSNQERYEIKDEIEAIIEEDEETYRWSKELSSITDFEKKESSGYKLPYKKENDEYTDFSQVLRLRLGKDDANELLSNYYPYILLKAMLGNKLNPPKNIDISIDIPETNYIDFMKFKINLKTS